MGDNMRFPSGYVPAEAPIQDYVGLKNMPAQQSAALEMSAPYKKAGEDLRVQSEKDDERRKAEDFRKVLQGGPETMYKFADEVTQKYPDFGKQLRAQVDGYAPLFKDPKLDRAGVEDVVTGFYKNAMDRMNELDKSSKGDPLLDLKKKNLESMIAHRKAMAAIARMKEQNKSKSAAAAAKAWQLAQTDTQQASDDLESLLAQTSGTYSPQWRERVDQAQIKYNKAQQNETMILMKLESGVDDDFFAINPEARPTHPDKVPAVDEKPKKRKYSIVKVE